MGIYYEYDPPSTLTGTDTFIIKQADASKSATIQDLITDIISPQIALTELGGLSDVNISGLANGNVLAYNSSSGDWEVLTLSPANPFDQDLNTTDSVDFVQVDASSTIFSLGTTTSLYGKLQDGWYPAGLNFDTDAAFISVKELTATPDPVDIHAGIFLQDAVDEFRGVQAYFQADEVSVSQFLNYMDVDGTGEFAFGGMTIGHSQSLVGRLEADLSMFITDAGGTGELQISLNPTDTAGQPDSMFDLYCYDELVNNPLMRLGNNGTNWKFTVDNDGTVNIPTGATYQINNVDLALSNLGDTNVSGVGVGEDGYALTWDNGTSRWVASAIATSLDALSDTNVSGIGVGEDGYALVWDNDTTMWIASPVSVDLTAVASNIVSATTNTYDLGSLTFEWKDLHLAGAVYKSGLELTPVVASDTAPTDTSVFWIDTSV